MGEQGTADAYKALVALPGGMRVVDVNVILDSSAGEPPVTAEEVVRLVAERLTEALVSPQG